MSAGTWIRRQRHRPIAEQERRTAMAAVVVLLTAIGVLLTLGQPASQASHIAHPPSHGWQAVPDTTAQLDPPALAAEAEGVARRFLAGYLAYTYGHARASQIADAGRSLIHSLQERPAHVPPAARARHPKVIALQSTAAPAGQLGVRAVVNDGGLIDFPIDLTLASQDGRLLVTGLDGAR
jgi:hypothetical protein